MVRLPHSLAFACVFFLAISCGLAGAQAYTSVVIFGDSLSDTGNVAHLTQSQFGIRFPSTSPLFPTISYTDGRFTDGPDSIPAGRLYTGVWIEQLAAALPAKPAVKASLDGGTNYAYGDATTEDGTTTIGYGTGGGSPLMIPISNMGKQVSDYLATTPSPNNKILYVVWGGANDMLAATTSVDISNAAGREVALIQRLITAGATDFIIPNLPPLGLIPRLNTSPATSGPATAAASGFNAALKAGLANLPAANPGKKLNLFQPDIFTLFNSVVAAPSANGLTDVTTVSQSQLVNPDNYLFWDDLHPTTTGHHIVSTTANKLLPVPALASSASPTSLTIARGSTGTSTITITPTGGYSGAVSLACGTLPAKITCSFAPASLTLAGDNSVQTSTLTIGTTSATALLTPSGAGHPSNPGTVSAFTLLPFLGGMTILGLRRRGNAPLRLLSVLVVLCSGALIGLSGCGGGPDNQAPAGSYTVPVNVTANNATSTISLTVAVQ